MKLAVPRPLLALLALASLAPLSPAQTVVGGPTQGVWDLAGSPYRLIADVIVPAGGTLEIQPGVEVIGEGSFRIDVQSAATFRAMGAEDARIRFTASNPATGWRGIRLVNATDNSHLQHCLIEHAVGTGSAAHVRGGGLMVTRCSPIVEDCEFRFCSVLNGNRNGAGGAILVEQGGGTYRRNHIHDNIADSGGGIAVIGVSLTHIHDNLISDNVARSYGGGIYINVNSGSVLERNRILRNHVTDSTGAGGGICAWSSIFPSTLFRGNVIAFNSAAREGGGAYLRYSRSTSDNNLYAFNSAPRGGGIFVLNLGHYVPLIRNSIIWGNSGPAIDLEASTGSIVTVTFSIVEGGWAGTGNLATAPRFLDPLGPDGVAETDDADFRLGAGSPAIDAAFANGTSGLVDANGEPRNVDDACTMNTGSGPVGFLDLGPFERQSSSCCSDPVNVCPATPNSASSGAYLGWLGSVSIASNNLALRAHGLPSQRTSVWFYGFGLQSTPVTLGGGLLCIAGPLYRIGAPLTSSVDGLAQVNLDLSVAPFSGPAGGSVIPGTTAWFQLWFLDGGAGGGASDTSDALAVTFCD